jgi:hypothetical protein
MPRLTCKEILTILLLATLVGCTKGTSNTSSIDGSQYQLTSEPTGAIDVLKLRSTAANDDAVVVVGRIGGAQPWIEGLAAFTLVDSSLLACNEIENDSCETPWDYCCETHKLPTGTALVKVVDEQGNLVQEDARQLLGVKELATVVIEGKAERDKTGNLTILANGVFIKQK